MEIVSRVSRMSALAAKALSSDVQIGLVPTMGLVHPGHISLIKEARRMTDLVIVSIFVDRLQFNTEEEYRRFPSDITKDADLLGPENVDYIFAPAEEEIYPAGFSTFVQIEKFGEKLSGLNRDIFFRGMTTSALKMIHIVRPSFFFLAEKDALEGAVLRKMIRDLNLNTEVVVKASARDSRGLAYAARNFFLSEEDHAAAAVISRGLRAAADAIARGETQTRKVIQEASRVIEAEPRAVAEYILVVDPESLEPAGKIQDDVLVSIGATISGTLLYDSLQVEKATA